MPGSKGVNGLPGTPGSRGPSGLRGSSGPQGPQGPKATPSVYFATYKKGGGNPKKEEIITYTTVISNKGNGLSSESGIFKAPLPGFYFFTFSGETLKSAKHTMIKVYHNSKTISFGDQTDEDHFGTLSASWQFKLAKHDTVKIKVSAGTFWAENLYFTGYLIEETT